MRRESGGAESYPEILCKASLPLDLKKKEAVAHFDPGRKRLKRRRKKGAEPEGKSGI